MRFPIRTYTRTRKNSRTHSCKCGLVIDRDLNAAINILKRATVGQTESKPVERATSLKQEAEKIGQHDTATVL